LLSRYLRALQLHPLRTKALTAAVLNGLQELLAQLISRYVIRRRQTAKQLAGSDKTNRLSPLPVDTRVIKMALYGFLVNGPLNHMLYDILARVFAGRSGFKYTLAQLLAANLCISPIMNSVYLSAMEVIAGRAHPAQIKLALQQRLLPMMRISWVLSPAIQLSAYSYLPQALWVPYFNFSSFLFGTYINAVAK
ncbi:hypothetical protein THASP1DRAFT_7302, partial [Thamnocephalis sphaerospora]